jgi:anaphase-promoting complex subunit 2
LLTDKTSDLFEELSMNVDAPPVQDSKDAAEDYNDPKWMPDPIDAPIGTSCSRTIRHMLLTESRGNGVADFRKSKGSDIIQSLVSIYDTKDVFIKELQVRIAQQLLAIQNYALEREVSLTSFSPSCSQLVPDHLLGHNRSPLSIY